MATKRDRDDPGATKSGVGRVNTQPYASRIDPSPRVANSDDPPSEKEYDPHRSGLNEYSTDLFKELIMAELPLVPKEELFETRPPNVRFATPSPAEVPHAPDPLPAVESPANSVTPSIHAQRNLVLGVFALAALALGLFFATRDSARRLADSPNTEAATDAVLPPVPSPSAAVLVASPPPPPTPQHQEPSKTSAGAPSAPAHVPRPPHGSSAVPNPSSGPALPQAHAVAHPALGPRPE